MTRSILKARYTLTPVQNSDNLVEIGILPKDLTKLCLKMTFWGMLPSMLIIGGLIVIGVYEDHKKPANSEDTNTDD